MRPFRPVLALAVALLGLAPAAAFAESKPARTGHSLAGQLLVAAPGLKDPYFSKTVIFMIEDNERGALGIVVNRLLGTGPASEILKGFGIDLEGASGTLRVNDGGPVQPHLGLVLHSADYVGAGTHLVGQGFAVTGDPAILREFSKGQGPKRVLFALGYAGWGPGQLESEMERDSWFVAPADEGIVFDDDLDSKWSRALAMSGIDL